MLSTGRENVIQSGFDAENISLPLIFPTEEDVEKSKGVYSIKSQLYQSVSQRDILASSNITMNNHFRGIAPNKFIIEPKLTSIFKITSTNMDMNGKPFVSTIESFESPFYGVQYHPEKNNFEYGFQHNSNIPYAAIDHSEEAVALSINLALFFVGKVRKNTFGRYTMVNKYPCVYKYEMLPIGGEFEFVYVIPPAQQWFNAVSSSENDQHIISAGPPIVTDI